MLIALQWISIIAAFLAAFFWFWSSLVAIPTITFAIIKDGVVKRPPHEAAFRRQSRMNAIAAAFAAIAAVAQGVSFYRLFGF